MASTYPKCLGLIPVSAVLTKALLFWIVLAVVSCSGQRDHNNSNLEAINVLIEAFDAEAARLGSITKVDFEALEQRVYAMHHAYAPHGNMDALEVLQSGLDFIAQFPQELAQAESEMAYFKEQLGHLKREAGLFTNEELNAYLAKEQNNLAVMSAKVDYLVNQFYAWQFNMEVFEKGLEQTKQE